MNPLRQQIPPHVPDDHARVQIQPAAGLRSLWLVRGDEGYGVRRAILGMVRELRHHGVIVGFASLHPGPFASEIEQAGHRLWILSAEGTPPAVTHRGFAFVSGVLRLLARSWVQRRVLAHVIRTFRADWLHVRLNTLLALAGLAARSCSIPAYWHLPNTIRAKLPLGLQALGTQLLCRILRVRPLANSRHTARSLGSALIRVRVLYPGVDPVHFSCGAPFARLSRAALSLDHDSPVFVIAARLVAEKAQDRVIEAVLRLAAAGRKLTLLIVGGPTEGAYHQRLVRRIAEAGAERWIRLTGSASDPRPYLELADVVVNSRAAAEPFGLTVVESMLMERPVLACALGGPGETVEDGVTGWLIHDPSVDGYEAGLARALGDRERWRAMGRRGRERALDRFTLERTTTTYLSHVTRDPALGASPAAFAIAASKVMPNPGR